MSDIAIRVENLSKAYRIGLKEQRHETLMGALASFVRSPWENYRNVRKLAQFDDVNLADGRLKMADSPSSNSQLLFPICSSPSDVIWALKDISFEVKHGEVLGIIGRNGAGKSTLLKILARITEPTSGRATIYGRVGSLLEVGTGFHPDLTGRENVYLNGTILGMSKKEVDNKFDEIVDFSGVEKFIDTPVKRYSSGMRVRLAFAVAAHLDPEILIIDEVLAVGDAEFQQKCLGKMQDVSKAGRTVLFVSHNMSAVKMLCQKGILLSSGGVSAFGDIGKVIHNYQTCPQNNPDVNAKASKSRGISLDGIRILSKTAGAITPDEPFTVCVTLRTAHSLPGYYLFCIIQSQMGSTIVHSRVNEKLFAGNIQGGDHVCKVCFPALWLTPGVYTIQFKIMVLGTNGSDRCLSDPLMLEVKGNASTSDTLGLLSPTIAWNLETS